MFELDLARLHAFGHKGEGLCHAAKGRIGCKPRNEGLRPTQAAERVAHLGERFEQQTVAREEVSAVRLHDGRKQVFLLCKAACESVSRMADIFWRRRGNND